MIDRITQAVRLIGAVENPLPAVLDKLGFVSRPYVLRLRDGGSAEVRPRKGDLFGFYEVMIRRDYLLGGQRLPEGGTVIDVGANIGCFSVLAARLVGPSGRVYALEPHPATYAQLVRNIELNGLTNVTALQLALGGDRGKVVLHVDPNALFSSTFESVNGHAIRGTELDVEMTTLGALMDERGIARCDYLKLDCEGAEHDIVAQMPADVAGRVRQITLEVHKVPGRDGNTLQSRLEALGYRRVGDSRLPFYELAGASETT